mgnify:CR=1 FL=1
MGGSAKEAEEPRGPTRPVWRNGFPQSECTVSEGLNRTRELRDTYFMYRQKRKLEHDNVYVHMLRNNATVQGPGEAPAQTQTHVKRMFRRGVCSHPPRRTVAATAV